MAAWSAFTSKQKTVAELVFDALSTMDGITDHGDASEAETQKIGFSDLYSFATRSDSMMDEELEHALKQDDRLRENLDKLLDEIALYHGKRVAAASTGKVDVREGKGFKIRLHESRASPRHIYIIIELKDPKASPPTAMFLRGSKPLCQKLTLPRSQDGIIQIMADSDSEMIEALRDIDTQVFLR